MEDDGAPSPPVGVHAQRRLLGHRAAGQVHRGRAARGSRRRRPRGRRPRRPRRSGPPPSRAGWWRAGRRRAGCRGRSGRVRRRRAGRAGRRPPGQIRICWLLVHPPLLAPAVLGPSGRRSRAGDEVVIDVGATCVVRPASLRWTAAAAAGPADAVLGFSGAGVTCRPWPPPSRRAGWSGSTPSCRRRQGRRFPTTTSVSGSPRYRAPAAGSGLDDLVGSRRASTSSSPTPACAPRSAGRAHRLPGDFYDVAVPVRWAPRGRRGMPSYVRPTPVRRLRRSGGAGARAGPGRRHRPGHRRSMRRSLVSSTIRPARWHGTGPRGRWSGRGPAPR